MWSWQSNKSHQPSKPSLAGSPFQPDFAPTPKQQVQPSPFNLRAHYQQLKENHPYYQQLYKPHQNVVKFSYLDAAKSYNQEPAAPILANKNRNSQVL